MSGTSVDGIDAGLFAFSRHSATLVASHSLNYPPDLKQKILQLSQPGANEIDQMGELDVLLGRRFAQAANELIAKAGLDRRDVVAIGSHGQTIRHRPQADFPFTLQIADPNTIAQSCGVTTVADLRRRDMSTGGEGAPLAPAFHQAVFCDSSESRCVVNIGGIANISVLNQDADLTIGYDTGPGNVLIDAWTQKQLGKPFDEDGSWARSGAICHALLDELMEHHFLAKPPPKSTGREDFNLSWLERTLTGYDTSRPADIQATLCEFTAKSLADALRRHPVSHVYLCGGGAHNSYLVSRISSWLPACSVDTTAVLGIPPDWVEAGLVAWLAKQALDGRPGNLPRVTGAKSRVVLGAIYQV